MEKYEVVELLSEQFLRDLEQRLWLFCKMIVQTNALEECNFAKEFNLAFLLREKILELIELGE